MTYADNYNIRTTSVKFNDVASALDGLITRNYAGLTTGTSTAYIATPSPTWNAYTTSGLIVIIPHVTNTGASTLNVSGLGAKDLKIANTALGSGVLQQNVPTVLAYTGTYFEVLLQNVSIPVGQINAYAGASAPTGWLVCNGDPVSRTTYATLFGIISTTYGSGDGSTTFNLPDLRRRTPIGTGSSDSLGGSDAVAYASRSSTQSHTVPAHYHGMGTGATLAVDIAHTHSSANITGTVGGSDGTHTHTITDPGHIHSVDRTASATSFGNVARVALPDGSGNQGTTTAIVSSNTTGISINSTNSGHGHSFSLTATLGATSKTPTGTIGLVTGGVDGNAAMTSGAGQYLYINYIIKF
ncbi:tail fiber protein [bacterium]|nr:tail fiber protein [bacterium]